MARYLVLFFSCCMIPFSFSATEKSNKEDPFSYERPYIQPATEETMSRVSGFLNALLFLPKKGGIFKSAIDDCIEYPEEGEGEGVNFMESNFGQTTSPRSIRKHLSKSDPMVKNEIFVLLNQKINDKIAEFGNIRDLIAFSAFLKDDNKAPLDCEKKKTDNKNNPVRKKAN